MAESIERVVDFSDYKVGDHVWGVMENDWMEITDIRLDNRYPVKLSNGATITSDGLNYIGQACPLYFHNRFEIPDSAFIKPRPEIELDAKIWVRDNDSEKWRPRHFAGEWDMQGSPSVFRDGRTSFTNDGRTVFYYMQYSLTEPTEEDK